jgi:hypothetical protein
MDIKGLSSDFNVDVLGLKSFTFLNEDIPFDEEENQNDDHLQTKFKLEVSFPNDMEMMDIHDDLLNRGYIVKIIN